jgi:Rieske 2Fe-2S family protein
MNAKSNMQQTLPSSWYKEDHIFHLEREHIFFREWLCVGREESLSGPGDHRVLDVLGESIILLRNTEGLLRAYYNVCRHRGAKLCANIGAEKSLLSGGISKKYIVCPYHSWTYDLDGQLVRAPHIPEDCDFDPTGIRLYPVAVETWCGFVFINLTPEHAKSFSDVVAHVPARFERYRMQDLRIGKTLRYEVAANWKIICENYNECYHCGPVHPELCRIVPSFKKDGGADLPWEDGIAHKEGANTFTMTGTTNRRMIPGLTEDEQMRHFGELVYPSLFISMSADHVAAFVLHAIDASHTVVECHFLFEPYAMEQEDYDPSDAVEFWDLINRQDWEVCERVQAGISSRVHHWGYCAPMEDLSLDIRRYVTERIGKFVDPE